MATVASGDIKNPFEGWSIFTVGRKEGPCVVGESIEYSALEAVKHSGVFL